MDLNHRSPGYEPDGISRLPHLAVPNATVLPFETTDVVFFHPLSALSSSRMTSKYHHERTNWGCLVVDAPDVFNARRLFWKR